MKVFVNVLTILRVIAIFLLPIFWNFKPFILVLFLTCILLTDFFDGFLARHYHVQTVFGTFLDSIADKLFGISTLFVLSRYHKSFLVVAIFELIIALVNIIGLLLQARTSSSIIGKVKMWVIGAMMVVGIITIFDDKIKILRPVVDLITKSNHLLDVFAIVISLISISAIVYYIRRIIIDTKKKTKKKFVLKDKKELMEVLFDTEYCLKNKDKPLIWHIRKKG